MAMITWSEVEATGYQGELYRIDVVLFDPKDGSGDATYWTDEDYAHNHHYEAMFTDLEESKAYADSFSRDMALWAVSHGIGPHYCSVSCEVTPLVWDERDSDYHPDYVIHCNDYDGIG